MKKLTRRMIPLLLTMVMLLSAVPAHAAGGLLGESFKVGSENPIYGTYSRTTNTRELKTYDWPDSGYIFVIVTDNYPLSAMNGVTIPPNLVVDAYQYHAGGTYTFIVRYDTTDGKSLTITNAGKPNNTGSTDTGTTIVAGFNDVRGSDYFAKAVNWAKETGVTAGTSATTFSPSAAVTRAEAMTFLWVAAGRPEPSAKTSPFTDVTPGDYYYKPVLWAAENKITSGVGNNLFGQDDPLTYEQILTFLCVASGGDVSGNWSQKAQAWAKEMGLTDGLSFKPASNCPRSDVVYFLWKQLSDEAAEDPNVQKPVQTGQPDPEGAKAAVIKGLSRHDGLIDLNAYNMDVSKMEDLAAELTVVGEHAMSVIYYRVNQNPILKTASTLSVRYGEFDSDHFDQILERVKAISASVVKPGMSEYEIAKALHDYLVLNCAYDEDWNLGDDGKPLTIITNDTAHSAYGALVKREAVCEGYALAYMALMRYNGIKCIFVSGFGAGDFHGWNIVQIDGEWYHVDTTWDDPVPNQEGYVRYDYFLKSDAVFRQDHSGWDEEQTGFLKAPTQWTPEYACTSTKYDNLNLPSTTEQAKQQEQKAQQEAEQKQLEEVAADALDQLSICQEEVLRNGLGICL